MAKRTSRTRWEEGNKRQDRGSWCTPWNYWSSAKSKKVTLIAEREDTRKLARLQIEDDKNVSDLLDLSRSKLNFERDAVLRAHKVGTDEPIRGAVYIREIAHLGTVVIKCTAIYKQEKCESNGRENSASEKNTSKAMRKRDNVNPGAGLAVFRQLSDDQSESSTTIRHKYSVHSDMEREKSVYEMAKTSKDVNKDKEIVILNKKLKSESLEGFVFEIVPGDYAHRKELITDYSQSSFSSQEERKAIQSKIRSTKDWSSWQTERGPPCWGVRVCDSVDRNIPARQHDRNMTQRTSETCSAIVTRTAIHQVNKFSVQVKLNDEAKEHAKKILKADMDKQRQAVNKFNNKYCSFVYSGQYSAGGWFQTVATAKSRKSMEFAVLVDEATKKSDTSWPAHAGKFGQRGWSPKRRTRSQSQRKLSAGYVPVFIREESAPRAIFSEGDLEKKIKNLQECTVMPSIGANKSQFTPVYEIMEKQAKANEDKELQKVAAIMKMYMKGSSTSKTNIGSPHYVVLLGDSGTGKSTIIEKLTGEKGRSSNASESFTRTSEPFWIPDGSLIVSDTPGSNSRKDKLEHNLSIAGALNFRPVSRIFIVVKAEPRIDSVIDKVCKYADNFEELPFDVVGVLVTHMDMVEWTEEDFIPDIEDELGINTVVFSWISTKGETLLSKILKTCLKKHDLTVNDENFSKLFKLQNSHRKILQFTSDEVKKFSAKKKAFDEERKFFRDKDQVDLVFEFQAYMTDEIVDAKSRMSEENNFTFEGDNAVTEAGHVINMVNQLHMVLRDIKTECFRYHCEHGVSEFRKCPYCSLVWTTTEGCSGNTICGDQRSAVNDTRDLTVAILGTFSFKWNGDKFEIIKSSDMSANSGRRFVTSFGCGKTINWNDMATVSVPSEISQSVKVCKSEIQVLPPTTPRSRGRVQNMIWAIEESIKSLYK